MQLVRRDHVMEFVRVDTRRVHDKFCLVERTVSTFHDKTAALPLDVRDRAAKFKPHAVDIRIFC